jgi:hypothetical protein
MKKMLLALCCVLLIGVPQIASAQTQAFDFLGQAIIPTQIGNPLSMYSTIQEGSPLVVPPLPLDFAGHDYTIVVSGCNLLTDNGNAQTFAAGNIAVYEDNVTVADYANTATFTDGTPILTGVLSGLSRSDVTLTIPPYSRMITILGTVDWTGGTHLDDLAPSDQTNWPFLAAGNREAGNVEPGFDEQWDGKVEPTEPVVGSEPTSFGGLKAGFNN